MLTVIAFIALLILVAGGVHIAIALGVVATLMLSFNLNIPIILIAQMAWGSIDGYALVAIPFFIFAGNLMTRGNLALVLLESPVRSRWARLRSIFFPAKAIQSSSRLR
jgi:C4-dicarboxylate transporter DctM subunit